MPARDAKLFNTSQPHEVMRMARKFNEPKEDVVAKIKELKEQKKIYRSTNKHVEELLLNEGFTLKK
jgi:hypothetical protein